MKGELSFTDEDLSVEGQVLPVIFLEKKD